MKNRALSSLITLTLLVSFHRAVAQGTVFTYQGRLNDSNAPVTGIYDLRFTIYDSGDGGSVVAGPITNVNIAVSNGLFTTALDFGADAFAGPARWLELGVRTNGSSGDFMTLTPRQPVTPTPYALFAGQAAMLAANASQTFTGTIGFNPSTPGAPPFSVASAVKVNNLNADLLDGLDSTNFLLKSEHCLNNIAELKARAAGFALCVTVLGYHAPGDGGGGLFYWDTATTEADNGGTILAPASNPPTGRWKRPFDGVLNVKWFGAVGDGTTNDHAAIQSAINTAPARGVVNLAPPPQFYRIAAALTLDKALTLMGEHSEIRQVTPNTPLLRVRASDVTIRRLELVGPQFTTPSPTEGERAIDAQGPSAASPIVNLRVVDNIIRSFGFYGIFLWHVTDFEVSGNRVADIWYAGVAGLSVTRGLISGNIVTNIVGSPNAYGIALSRYETDSLATEPRSSDVLVSGNIVRSVPNWVGLDTHGGQRLTFCGNLVTETKLGIGIGSADGDNQVTRFAPLDVVVADNILDSGKTNGTAGYGIAFTGAPGVLGAPRQKATGVISGNVIRGYGDSSNDISGAIYIHNTEGLVISGNTLIEPSPIGIQVYDDNYGTIVTGNSITDPWSDSGAVGFAPAVCLRSIFNTVQIGENSFIRAARSASYVLDPAIYVAIHASNKVNVGVNRSDAALSLYDPGHHASAHVSATVNWDPPALDDGNVTSTTVTVNYAEAGDTAAVGFSQAVPAGALLLSTVTSVNTVTVTLFNKTGALLDLGSGTLRADVWKH